MTTDTKTTTYTVVRDSIGADSDFDRAMAHDLIYTGYHLASAQRALVQYLKGEALYLDSHGSRDRSRAILAKVPEAEVLTPSTDTNWTRAEIQVVGLSFTMVRSVKTDQGD